MGPVMVLGSFYVQTQTLTWPAVWLSLPVACLVTAILIANNLRDANEDRLSGKTTLVHLWGRQPVALLYCALLLIAFASIAVLVFTRLGSWPWLAPLLILPPSRCRRSRGLAEHGTPRPAPGSARYRPTPPAFRPAPVRCAGTQSTPARMIVAG